MKHLFQKVIKGRYRYCGVENLHIRKEWESVGESEGQKACHNELNKCIMTIHNENLTVNRHKEHITSQNTIHFMPVTFEELCVSLNMYPRTIFETYLSSESKFEMGSSPCFN